MKHLAPRARDGGIASLGRVDWNNILSPVAIHCQTRLGCLGFPGGSQGPITHFLVPHGPPRSARHPNKKYLISSSCHMSPQVLAALAPSLHPAEMPGGDLCLLIVGQPPSDGLPSLPCVITELEDAIRKPLAQTVLVESSLSTVEEVLGLMKETYWVHFACHGIQDGVDSGLCLADGRRLKLRDMVASSRHRGGLAFLSACQTATGDKGLSDGAIHIVAGMLFEGYGGVVGSMWSISDAVAPRLARGVYARLLEKGTRPDYRDAAQALHDAIKGLRRREVPFDEWSHVGL